MKRVFNFGAGPAMLPTSVMEKARDEFLDYKGLGAGLIEISHRSKEFDAVIDRTDALFRELSGLPDNYRLVFVLRTFDNLSYGDIATSVECPEGTVKSRLNQARKLLKECLTRRGLL